MAANILLVFEGQRTESTYKRILDHYIKNDLIEMSFGGDIYTLYNTLNNDGGNKDLLPVLKERSNNEHLKDYSINSFGEIYLFFDYDSHSTNFDFGKLNEMISFFKDETENGKLFISYPMIESLKHMQDIDNQESFIESTFICKNGSNYKRVVSECCDRRIHRSVSKRPIHINEEDIIIYNKIVYYHCVKANFIVNNIIDFPSVRITQDSILSAQYEFSKNNKDSIYVLNSFPLMLLHYFDIETLKSKL